MCAFAHNIQITVQNVISVYACMSSMSMYVFYCPVYVLDVFCISSVVWVQSVHSSDKLSYYIKNNKCEIEISPFQMGLI